MVKGQDRILNVCSNSKELLTQYIMDMILKYSERAGQDLECVLKFKRTADTVRYGYDTVVS